MVRKKCDRCGEIKKVSKFPRRELRLSNSKTEEIGSPSGVSVRLKKVFGDYIHSDVQKLEKSNLNFQRKSRLCQECEEIIFSNVKRLK
tara:strand:- start:11356 stop:11619 length:264 start_codon:yes stop_codon:yes gene_type:complete